MQAAMVLATSRDMERRMWHRAHYVEVACIHNVVDILLECEWRWRLMLHQVSLDCPTPWWANQHMSQVAAFLTTSVSYRVKKNCYLSGYRRRSLCRCPRTNVEGRRCNARGVGSRFRLVWRGRCGVNMSVNDILVIADAVTVKPVDWCYICCQQDKSKNGPLWNTGAGLSYRLRRLADTDVELSAGNIWCNQTSAMSLTPKSNRSFFSSAAWITVSKSAEILRPTNATMMSESVNWRMSSTISTIVVCVKRAARHVDCRAHTFGEAVMWDFKRANASRLTIFDSLKICYRWR